MRHSLAQRAAARAHARALPLHASHQCGCGGCRPCSTVGMRRNIYRIRSHAQCNFEFAAATFVLGDNLPGRCDGARAMRAGSHGCGMEMEVPRMEMELGKRAQQLQGK